MIAAQDAPLAAAFAQPDVRAVAIVERIMTRARASGGALDNVGAQAALAVGEDVLTLIAQGQSPAFIARYLRRAFGLPYARMTTFVRTASAYASNEAAAAAQVENARLLRGWMWSSSKDARTCAACLARDGEIFPVGAVLNDHHAGRCVSIPVTRDDDWTGSYERGRDWYERQSRADQALLVGKGTRDLLAQGGTSWEAIPEDYQNFTLGLMSRRQPLYALRENGPSDRFRTTLRVLGDR
jgi:SPP1 gp7 family putative phage head morphogenesis protein